MDGMLQKLAHKLHRFETEVFRRLTENGLGMDVNEVNTCLHDKNAKSDLLKNWRASQPNWKTAYANLHHTLLKENMDELTAILVGIILIN